MCYCINTYNWLCHMFVLLVIYLEGSDVIKKKNLKDLLVGIALGLVFLSKQSIGAYCIIAYIILKLLQERRLCKSLIIHYILSAIGFWISLLPFAFYLLKNQCFSDFWDLCFNGALNFASENLLPNSMVIFIVVILFIFNIINVIKCYKNGNKFELTMSVFNLALLGFSYPIFDHSHMFFGILPSLVLVLNKMWHLVRKNRVLKMVTVYCYNFVIPCVAVCIFLMIFHFLTENFKSDLYPGDLSFYNYSFGFSKENIFVNNTIYNYIQQKKKEGYNALAVTPFAPHIFAAHKDYNMKYDILLTGNLGKNGEQNVIDYLESVENPLIIHTYQHSYQETKKVHEYIVNNYSKIDEFYDLFEVYVREN